MGSMIEQLDNDVAIGIPIRKGRSQVLKNGQMMSGDVSFRCEC
jgi:hypothetical protein